MEKVYLLGDMLKKGSVICREQEAKELRELGYNLYSAIEQKDINDKSSQTVESNNTLAERIVKKDTDAIRASSIIVAEVDNNNIGSCVELGQIKEMNYYYTRLREFLDNGKDLREQIEQLLREIPFKKVYCHTTDIRHTNIPEQSFRRSFSFNQYLVGVCLELDNKGIRTFEEIMKELGDDE